MNVSRLADFSARIAAAETEQRVGKKLSQISGSLQNIINDPQNAQHQTDLLTRVSETRTALEAIEAQITPPIADFLEELDASYYFSVSMIDDIAQLIHTNSITQAAVKTDVDEIHARRSKFVESITALSTALKAVGLGPRPLQPGEAEIGFKIPRAIFDNRLIGFSGELKFIERVVELFSEAVTGQREEAELSELSTTEPLVILQLYAPIVAAIAGSITWFLATYKQTLELRELRARLKAVGVDESAMLDAKIEQLVNEAVEKRVADVVTVKLEDGRRNEVSNGLRLVLKDLWARVELGMTVEVRFLPPATSEEPTAKEKKELKIYEDLRKIQRELVFPTIRGEPFLRLSKPDGPKTSKKRSTPSKAKKSLPKKAATDEAGEE
ncbi:hypothetical protein [Hyphomicrobium sp. CS1GBMeth3]|uniref:hypothetical protein n=1 Tax=Hyphomicrobium sp. CS1GBMeth3 TaxID=1892845 RepID=UPI000931B345|nr:hypothetical protein [Hyphomicrobium sp. CS1GBMeth3]